MARTPFTLKSGNTTSFKDMGSSPARKMGSFIDGERVTYAQARKAEQDPDFKGQVVYTNKDAEKASAEDTRKGIADGEQKETYTGQDGATHTNPGLNLAEAQKNIFKGGNQKDIDIDTRAQNILENSTKAKDNANLWKSTGGEEGVGPNVAGRYNAEGYRGSNAKIAEEMRFLKDNSKLEVTNGSAKGVRSQYSPNANESGKDIMGFQEIQNEKKKERETNSAKNSQTNTPRVYQTGKKKKAGGL